MGPPLLQPRTRPAIEGQPTGGDICKKIYVIMVINFLSLQYKYIPFILFYDTLLPSYSFIFEADVNCIWGINHLTRNNSCQLPSLLLSFCCLFWLSVSNHLLNCYQVSRTTLKFRNKTCRIFIYEKNSMANSDSFQMFLNFNST